MPKDTEYFQQKKGHITMKVGRTVQKNGWFNSSKDYVYMKARRKLEGRHRHAERRRHLREWSTMSSDNSDAEFRWNQESKQGVACSQRAPQTHWRTNLPTAITPDSQSLPRDDSAHERDAEGSVRQANQAGPVHSSKIKPDSNLKVVCIPMGRKTAELEAELWMPARTHDVQPHSVRLKVLKDDGAEVTVISRKFLRRAFSRYAESLGGEPTKLSGVTGHTIKAHGQVHLCAPVCTLQRRHGVREPWI